jgi:Type IV secretion system pilin
MKINLLKIVFSSIFILSLFFGQAFSFFVLAEPTGGSPAPAKPFQNTLETLNATAKGGGYAVDASTDEKVIIGTLLGRVVQILLSLVGVGFAILMIYGGITWMTAGGEETKVTNAKNIIRNSIIGIIVIFSAFLITRFLDDVIKTSIGTPAAPLSPEDQKKEQFNKEVLDAANNLKLPSP